MQNIVEPCIVAFAKDIFCTGLLSSLRAGIKTSLVLWFIESETENFFFFNLSLIRANDRNISSPLLKCPCTWYLSNEFEVPFYCNAIVGEKCWLCWILLFISLVWIYSFNVKFHFDTVDNLFKSIKSQNCLTWYKTCTFNTK